MKKLLGLLICISGLITLACTGENKLITKDQLPATAQQFIARHFSNMHIANLEEDTHIFTRSYRLHFTNGSRINFTKDGIWTDVECRYPFVPTAILPMPIREYLQHVYPEIAVRRIMHYRRGYLVELDNGFKLQFDKKLQFKTMNR